MGTWYHPPVSSPLSVTQDQRRATSPQRESGKGRLCPTWLPLGRIPFSSFLLILALLPLLLTAVPVWAEEDVVEGPCPDGFVVVAGRGVDGELAAQVVASAGVRLASSGENSPPWCRSVVSRQVDALPADWRPSARALLQAAERLSPDSKGEAPPLAAPRIASPVPAWLAVASYEYGSEANKGRLSVWLYRPGGGAPRTDARVSRPDGLRRVAAEVLGWELSSPWEGGVASGSPPVLRLSAQGAASDAGLESFFRVPPGGRASFSASESGDPDGDSLSFRWNCTGKSLPEGGVQAEGAEFSPDLGPGFYGCALEASDGAHVSSLPFAVTVASRGDVAPTLKISLGGGGWAGAVRGKGYTRYETGTLSGYQVPASAILASPVGEGRLELVLPGRFFSVEGSAQVGVAPGKGVMATFGASGRLALPLLVAPRSEAQVGLLGGFLGIAAGEEEIATGAWLRTGFFAQVAGAAQPRSAVWVSPRLEVCLAVSLASPGQDYTSRDGEYRGTRATLVWAALAIDMELRPIR